MPANVAAAAVLALTMLIATVGTIYQVDAAEVPRSVAPCPSAADAGTALSPSTHWEASLRQAIYRTERGLLKMAGIPTAR